MSLGLKDLRPLQSLAASILFQKRRLIVILPRQKGGKTELGVRLIYDLTEKPFTSSALFLAKSHPAAKKMVREKFMRLFPKERFAVNTEMVYLKSHPTSVCFIDSVDRDPDRARGGTHSLIHWAEVAFSRFEHGQTIIDVFDKIINPTLAETNGYLFLESTCNGKNGFYDLWENYKDFGFSRLRISLSDMVYMGLVEPEEYERIRSTTQPDVFRQEYECEWIVFQGKTYPEFDPGFHIYPEMAGPEDWQTVIMGIDWGYTPSATCVLFAYVKGDEIMIFDEHYKTEELAIHTADAIRGKIAYWKVKKFAAVADHEQDRIDELVKRGIACAKAEKVDVLGNRVQIKEVLFQKKIRIHPRCEFLLRDLQAAVWHPKKSDKGDLDDTQCTWGHWDAEAALRYLIRELSDHREVAPDRNPLITADSLSAEVWRQNMERRREWQEQ